MYAPVSSAAGIEGGLSIVADISGFRESMETCSAIARTADMLGMFSV